MRLAATNLSLPFNADESALMMLACIRTPRQTGGYSITAHHKALP